MSPRALTIDAHQEVPLLRVDTTVAEALRRLADAEVPALPVVDDRGRLRGIFGEREFIAALFPKYLDQLHSAAFVPRSLEDMLEKRSACATEAVGDHMNTEHVEVGTGHSDTALAETFLHHRVLIVPVVEGGRVTGIVTREAFFARLAARFLELAD